MTIGRAYQNSLLVDLRGEPRKAHEPSKYLDEDDTALMKHLEHQLDMRLFLRKELRDPSAQRLLDQYSFYINSGLFFSEIDEVIKDPELAAYRAIRPKAVETVGGEIIKLTPVDQEANQLSIRAIVASMSGGVNKGDSAKAQELIGRLARPDGRPRHEAVSAGIFAEDRLELANKGVIVGMGRSISLLDALQNDCLLEISFDSFPLTKSNFRHHELTSVPVLPHIQTMTLADAAFRILQREG